MREELERILEATGYPAALQGTIGDYPESFYTYWNFDTPETFYDNTAVDAVWGFWIFFFSTDPALVDSEIKAVITRLRAAGWVVEGRGEDALSDEHTHTGRRLTVYKRENL